MTHRPGENGVTFATSATSAKSSAIAAKSSALRIVATGQNTFVAIGTEPTATTANYAIPKDSAATLAFSKNSASIVARHLTLSSPSLKCSCRRVIRSSIVAEYSPL